MQSWHFAVSDYSREAFINPLGNFKLSGIRGTVLKSSNEHILLAQRTLATSGPISILTRGSTSIETHTGIRGSLGAHHTLVSIRREGARPADKNPHYCVVQPQIQVGLPPSASWLENNGVRFSQPLDNVLPAGAS